MFSRTIPARSALALTASLMLLASSPVSAQAPTKVTIKVKAATSTLHTGRFCHKHKRVRVFRKGARLEYKGLVTPAPAKHFPVSLRIEVCSGGRFHVVQRHQFQGKRASGRYKAFFTAPKPGRRAKITYFAARARVNGVTSPRRYFGVHR